MTRRHALGERGVEKESAGEEPKKKIGYALVKSSS